MGDEPLEWRVRRGELEMIPRYAVEEMVSQARLDALEEAEKALDELMDWADLTDCLVAIRALKEKQPECG